MAAPIFEKKKYYLYAEGAKPQVLLVGPKALFPLYENIVKAVSSVTDIELIEDKYEIILQKVEGAHALIGCPRHHFSKEMLERGKETLKWVHNPGAGIEEFLIPEFVESNIIFTNGKIIQGPECADHALALLLSLTRRLHLVQKGVAKKDLPRPIELLNKKAVVFGLGGIGLNIVQRAFGFGMKVYGVDPQMPAMLNMLEDICSPDDGAQLCEDADVIFIGAPHTWDSQNYFNIDFFRSLTKKPFLISVSRGSLVHTADLCQAIEEELFSGVGLDVTNPEPLNENHPLHKMENVLITPHIAGLSDFNRDRSFSVIIENIKRFCSGRPLQNIVNKNYGY